MIRWLLLGGAIATEVTATLSLKAALDHPAWYVLVVIGYVAAFTLISAAMRNGLGLGVAYGIWAALGVALTAILSHLIFHEPLTPVMIAGLGLIIVGVLLIEFGSHRAQDASRAAGNRGASIEEVL